MFLVSMWVICPMMTASGIAVMIIIKNETLKL